MAQMLNEGECADKNNEVKNTRNGSRENIHPNTLFHPFTSIHFKSFYAIFNSKSITAAGHGVIQCILIVLVEKVLY